MLGYSTGRIYKKTKRFLTRLLSHVNIGFVLYRTDTQLRKSPIVDGNWRLIRHRYFTEDVEQQRGKAHTYTSKITKQKKPHLHVFQEQPRRKSLHNKYVLVVMYRRDKKKKKHSNALKFGMVSYTWPLVASRICEKKQTPVKCIWLNIRMLSCSSVSVKNIFAWHEPNQNLMEPRKENMYRRQLSLKCIINASNVSRRMEAIWPSHWDISPRGS